MRRLATAPTKDQLDSPRVTDFLQTLEQRCNVYESSTDPTADQVPAGQWVFHKNTTTGDVKLWTNDSGTLRSMYLGTSATNTLVKLEANNPVFSAYLNGTQVVPSATFTKVTLNGELYDPTNSFDSTVNYRFQPSVAGYYRINAAVYFNASVAGSLVRAYLSKNGSVYKAGLAIIAASAAQHGSVCSTLIPMNGTTDYVELLVYQGTGINQTLNGNAFSTGTDVYMDGELVRNT
jgi:hypothetical protein